MSFPSSQPPQPTSPGPYRKPRADVYTVLLALALLAVILGCVFMYLETQDYPSPPYEGGPTVCLPAQNAAALIAAAQPATECCTRNGPGGIPVRA